MSISATRGGQDELIPQHPASRRSAEATDAVRPGGGVAGLFRLVGTRPWSLGAACLSAIASAVVGLLPLLVVYGIAIEVTSSLPNRQRVIHYALLGLVAAVGKHLLAAISTSLAHVAAFGILHDLRVRLARKMADVPLGFFSRHQTGDLHKAMNEDVNGLEAFLAHMLPDAAAALTVPLVAMLAMLAVDWRLTLAAFAAVPLAILAQISMVNKESRAAYDRYHEVSAATKKAVHNYLRGIHVIKAFNLDAQSFGELSRAVDAMSDYVEDYARRSAPPFIVAMKLFSGGTNALFVVPVGVWLYRAGTLDISTFVFFLLVSTQVLSPFLRIATAVGQLQLLLRGAENVQTLLDAPSLAKGTGQSVPAELSLRYRNVSFGYRDRKVIDGLDFEAPAGCVTALVGASGAGKTTALRLLPRFWDVDAGCIEAGGSDVRDFDLDDWLAKISLVFQEVFLFRGTVAENLRVAKPGASDAELESACRAARLHEAIAALPLGYATELGERGARLSGGERQRLSLARAFLKDAPILLLDEATAYADPQSEALVQAAIDELARGKTVMVVAHRLSTIRHADHIVVLEAGRVVAQGTHDTLLANSSVYRGLWNAFETSMDWKLKADDLQEGTS